MISKNMQKYLWLAGVGLLLAACGNGAEITRISEELKLSEPEVKAFRICSREWQGKKMPVIDVAGRKMKMTRVPLEICGCAAPAIARVYNADGVRYGFTSFASFASKKEKKRIPKILPEYLQEGVKREEGVKIVWQSFSACTAEYLSAFKAQSKDLMVLVIPKDKKKKKKDGHGTPEPKQAATAPATSG